LDFQSPTTTQKDKDIAGYLAEISQLDIESFAEDIFQASIPSEKQTMYEMLVQDIKCFDIEGVRTMISQVIVPSAVSMRDREDEILRTMEQLNAQKGLDLYIVCFTSIIENGSIFYVTGDYSQKALEVLEPRSFHKGIFSRKKQIIPLLADVFA
jgi:manganese-dependent inorganic pyrophosphatase